MIHKLLICRYTKKKINMNFYFVKINPKIKLITNDEHFEKYKTFHSLNQRYSTFLPLWNQWKRFYVSGNFLIIYNILLIISITFIFFIVVNLLSVIYGHFSCILFDRDINSIRKNNHAFGDHRNCHWVIHSVVINHLDYIIEYEREKELINFQSFFFSDYSINTLLFSTEKVLWAWRLTTSGSWVSNRKVLNVETFIICFCPEVHHNRG